MSDTCPLWREQLLRLLLWYNVLSLAVWLGGTVYQMIVIVPLWNASPPESLRAFLEGTEWRASIRNFFGVPTQIARALPLFALVPLAWSSPAIRPWVSAAAGAMLFGVALTRLYVYPINDALFWKAGAGMAPNAVRDLLRAWILADRVRFAVMAGGFVCLLKAFATR